MKIHLLREGPDKPAHGVCISNLPNNGVQRINSSLLKGHEVSRFITVINDVITVNTVDGPVVFNVEREPGRYCLTCGEQLPDHAGNGTALEAKRAQACRDHVASHGAKAEKSPKWPHGYESYPNSYLCNIDDQRA